jgi:tRNA (guanine-N7-)-methyltransferase
MDVINKLEREKEVRLRLISEFLSNIYNTSPNISHKKVNLEIGCGHGHWLASFAEKKGDEVFIGIDLITKRIDRALRKVKNDNIQNLFFLKAEATEFLSALHPSLLLSQCYIMYPDPWPKARHHKRRLINESFLNQLAEKSTSDAQFFFRSDHIEYFQWTTQITKSSCCWEISDSAWPHEHQSFFQNLLPKHQSFSARKKD